jgi:hypothetical protein
MPDKESLLDAFNRISDDRMLPSSFKRMHFIPGDALESQQRITELENLWANYPSGVAMVIDTATVQQIMARMKRKEKTFIRKCRQAKPTTL